MVTTFNVQTFQDAWFYNEKNTIVNNKSFRNLVIYNKLYYHPCFLLNIDTT